MEARFSLRLRGNPREDVVSDDGWIELGSGDQGGLYLLCVSFDSRKVFYVVRRKNERVIVKSESRMP